MLNRIGKKLGYKEGGFTIIEVLIVLAVAGLIMAIVLVAIPQLQRNQRNQARRDVANRMKTELDAYAGNNNGRIPDDATEINNYRDRYLSGVNTEDPSTGLPMAIIFQSGTITAGTPNLDDSEAVLQNNDNGTPADTSDDFTTKTSGGDLGVIYYSTTFRCNGESVESVPGGNRNYVFVTVQEGGAIYCVDNN